MNDFNDHLTLSSVCECACFVYVGVRANEWIDTSLDALISKRIISFQNHTKRNEKWEVVHEKSKRNKREHKMKEENEERKRERGMKFIMNYAFRFTWMSLKISNNYALTSAANRQRHCKAITLLVHSNNEQQNKREHNFEMKMSDGFFRRTNKQQMEKTVNYSVA